MYTDMVYPKNPNFIRERTYDPAIPADLARYLVRNPYAFPGGYPLFAITADGGALCKACCRSEYRDIRVSTPNDGWHINAIDVNYEDVDLRCDHCGARIESAYGED